jgi:hypothetical protein
MLYLSIQLIISPSWSALVRAFVVSQYV